MLQDLGVAVKVSSVISVYRLEPREVGLQTRFVSAVCALLTIRFTGCEAAVSLTSYRV